MLVFPQLSTGASTQYPIGKQVSQRSIQSVMEDGTVIALADSSASYIRWKLILEDLSDQEAGSVRDFFGATQGSLHPFLFLDPTTNLLVWTEDFSQSAWETAGLSFEPAAGDPFGGSRATLAHNQSGASAAVAQESQIPGSEQTCFSVYLRADTPTIATLTCSAGSPAQSLPVAVTTGWQRFYVSGRFPGVTDLLRYAVTIPAGASLSLFGPQVDAQVSPSRYVTRTGRSGVYTNARFEGNYIDITATGPDRNTCVVFIRCNLPDGE